MTSIVPYICTIGHVYFCICKNTRLCLGVRVTLCSSVWSQTQNKLRQHAHFSKFTEEKLQFKCILIRDFSKLASTVLLCNIPLTHHFRFLSWIWIMHVIPWLNKARISGRTWGGLIKQGFVSSFFAVRPMEQCKINKMYLLYRTILDPCPNRKGYYHKLSFVVSMGPEWRMQKCPAEKINELVKRVYKQVKHQDVTTLVKANIRSFIGKFCIINS